MIVRRLLLATLLLLLMIPIEGTQGAERRLLYVATPGIRNYLDYGGHGLLVFDIQDNHKFVKRIPTGGLDKNGNPINVKGICASEKTGLIHISTIKSLICIDLLTEKVKWEKQYDKGCDRMALSPDGKTIFQPSFEKDEWYILDAETGNELGRVRPNSRAHNTIYGQDGKFCYLAGLGSPVLSIVDTTSKKIVREVGPFTENIRPFTINGSQTKVFVCINKCLGFEIGDLTTGKKLHRVEVAGFQMGKVKRHGCPSHGIGMTPDEKEIWLCDAHNKRMHVFDATQMPPAQVASIECRDEPGWITFSMDGSLAYPSSGEVIDVKTRKIVAKLTDEEGRAVGSEKLVEIIWEGDKPIRAGNQFGIGQVR